MNQELLEACIDHWEDETMEVVRTIDTHEMTVERILKYRASSSMEMVYRLHRYVQYGIPDHAEFSIRVECSVDLEDVDADTVIQTLAERL